MSNILKFQKPKKQDKKSNNPMVVRIMVVTLILLAILKLPELLDRRPPIYKDHDVVKLQSPIKIPADYIVYDLKGKSSKISESLGEKVTILAFWATWCGFCAKEFPEMDDTVPYLSRHGVKILPVARGDDTPEKINQFFERGGIRNTQSVIASDPSLYKELGVNGYPTFIAVDENGMAFAKLRPKWSSSNIFELFEKLGESKNN